jgi:hypothetical protein
MKVLYTKTHMLCRCCSLDMSPGITPLKPWLSRPLHIQGVVLNTVLAVKSTSIVVDGKYI